MTCGRSGSTAPFCRMQALSSAPLDRHTPMNAGRLERLVLVNAIGDHTENRDSCRAHNSLRFCTANDTREWEAIMKLVLFRASEEGELAPGSLTQRGVVRLNLYRTRSCTVARRPGFYADGAPSRSADRVGDDRPAPSLLPLF
jgi:hypothetical protein